MAPFLQWMTGRPLLPRRLLTSGRPQSYPPSPQTLHGDDDAEDQEEALLGDASAKSSYKTTGASVMPSRGNRALRIYSAFISITCIGLVISRFGSHTPLPPPESPIAAEYCVSPVSADYTVLETCGNSIAEAKAKGCQFDDLIKAWMPSTCPRYGTKEFMASGAAWVASQLNEPLVVELRETGSWPYFDKLDNPVQFTPEEVAALGDKQHLYPEPGSTWFSSHREHLHHCAWVLKRLSNAYTHGLRADDQTRTYSHIEHCVNMMLAGSLQAPGVEEVNTRGNVWFGSC